MLVCLLHKAVISSKEYSKYRSFKDSFHCAFVFYFDSPNILYIFCFISERKPYVEQDEANSDSPF